VTARADDDQPSALHNVAGRVFVRMRVLQELAATLGFGEVVVLVDHRASAHLFERRPLDISRRERVRQVVWLMATHRGDALRDQHPGVDIAP
jgi:ABC-type Zn2+ transport system substrate-binding protein/surface adhesin